MPVTGWAPPLLSVERSGGWMRGRSLLFCVSVFISTFPYWDKIHVHIHCGLPPFQREMRLTCQERGQFTHKLKGQRIRRETNWGTEETREESRSAMVCFNHQPDILESSRQWASKMTRRDWFSYANRCGFIHLRQHHSLGLRSLPIWVEKLSWATACMH